MCLGLDPPNKDIMKYKPTGKNEKIINKRITLLTVFISLKKVILMFGIFWFAYWLSNSLLIAQTVSFTWLVLSHFVRIAAIRFDEKVGLFVNKSLNLAIIIPIIFQFIIIYIGLSSFFNVKPLNITEWLILFSSFCLAIFLAKVITYYIDKHIDRESDPY